MSKDTAATERAAHRIPCYIDDEDVKILKHYCVDANSSIAAEVRLAVKARIKSLGLASAKPAAVEDPHLARLKFALDSVKMTPGEFDRLVGVGKGTTRNALKGVVDVASAGGGKLLAGVETALAPTAPPVTEAQASA